MQRMGSWLASAAADAHNRHVIRPALTTAGKLARALLLVVNHTCIHVIRVIRVIRGQILFLLFLANSDYCVHGCFSPQSFWKRGSLRNGSNIGSRQKLAGVKPDGIESSFCKAAMARSGSPDRAAMRAKVQIGPGP